MMPFFRRLSRLAFTFVLMNYSVVAGLFALRQGQRIWKQRG